MRSLIIIEVEHGETTDPVQDFVTNATNAAPFGIKVLDYTVKIDLPECFVLDVINPKDYR